MEPTPVKMHMTTEMRNPATMDLDIMSPLEVVTVMNLEDEFIAHLDLAELPALVGEDELAG